LDHGMAGGMKMRRRMLVGRIVAAADVAAAAADAQVQPAAATLQAFLASERAWRDVLDIGHMATSVGCHRVTPRPLRRNSHLSTPRSRAAGFAVSAKYPCSAAPTCAPSPIAPPTRLTEPERTSPTANTPGTVVSNAATGRLAPPSIGTPVNTKP